MAKRKIVMFIYTQTWSNQEQNGIESKRLETQLTKESIIRLDLVFLEHF